MSAVLAQLSAMQFDEPAPSQSVRRPDTGLTDERFEWYVWVYEQWYFDNGIFTGSSSGRSRTAAVVRSTASTDSDAMYIAVCRRCAEAFDALLLDLPISQRTAFLVEHCDLPNVARFREPHVQRYAAARLTLSKGLRRRGFD